MKHPIIVASGLASVKPSSYLIRMGWEGMRSVATSPLRDPFPSKTEGPVVTCLRRGTAAGRGEPQDQGVIDSLKSQAVAENRNYDFPMH